VAPETARQRSGHHPGCPTSSAQVEDKNRSGITGPTSDIQIKAEVLRLPAYLSSAANRLLTRSHRILSANLVVTGPASILSVRQSYPRLPGDLSSEPNRLPPKSHHILSTKAAVTGCAYNLSEKPRYPDCPPTGLPKRIVCDRGHTISSAPTS
jgi:hypothetical protein